MRFSKKAIMGMSISTVVMLVIAVFFIGAAIYFIRDAFPSVPPIDVEITRPPTASDPLVLPAGSVPIKLGEEISMAVGYYNRKQGTVNARVEISECATTTAVDSDFCDGNLKPILTSLSQTVEIGEKTTFRTRVKASCVDDAGQEHRLPPGAYICNVKVVDGDEILEQDSFEITVTT